MKESKQSRKKVIMTFLKEFKERATKVVVPRNDLTLAIKLDDLNSYITSQGYNKISLAQLHKWDIITYPTDYKPHQPVYIDLFSIKF